MEAAEGVEAVNMWARVAKRSLDGDAFDNYTLDQIDACVPKSAHVCVPERDQDQYQYLYVVTTIARNNVTGGVRALAICNDFVRAKQIIETNEGDIWEFSYHLAVIEPFMEGAVYGGLSIKKQYWYRWNKERGGYEPIETPPMYERVLGIGIG